MKINRQSIALFAAIALPFTLNAQTSGSSGTSSSAPSGSQNPEGSSTSGGAATGGSSSDNSPSSGSGSRAGSSGYSGSGSPASNSADVSGSSASSGTSSSGNRSNQPGASGSDGSAMGSGSSSMAADMSVQRVTKDSLDRQLTAKNLIDKDVYDRDQKKIGKVVDVVLANQSSPLASAFSNWENHGSSSSSIANSTGADGGSSTGKMDSGRSSSGAGVGGGMSGMSSSGASGMSSEVFVVIAHGGMLKMGKDLIRAPLSQLTYDSNQKRLTLNVSGAEISGLAATDPMSR